MRAVVLNRTGGPRELRVEDIKVPTIAAGEVLVEVKAIGVNPFDTKVRSGMFAPKTLPVVLGSDIAGVVVASRTASFSEGDCVVGFGRSGAYAQYTSAAEPELVRLPAEVSMEQAAGLPVPGVIAWQSLFEAGALTRSDVVIIAGAAGGVGHISVQLASAVGATVIATASGEDGEFVASLGADEVLDYRKIDVSDLVKADLVLDCVGGRNTVELCAATRDGAVIVSLGAPLPDGFVAPRGIRVVRPMRHADPLVLTSLVDRVAQQSLVVCVSEVLELADAWRAHELIEAGRSTGKVVLVP